MVSMGKATWQDNHGVLLDREGFGVPDNVNRVG
jgi:hypothetical protein